VRRDGVEDRGRYGGIDASPRRTSLNPPAPFPHLRRRVDWLDVLQWPAMATTVLAAWMTASQSRRRRRFGFAFFLLSNILWTTWAYHARAWALIVLQLFLCVTNIRGVVRNDPET
jgi:hypothetical protein